MIAVGLPWVACDAQELGFTADDGANASATTGSSENSFAGSSGGGGSPEESGPILENGRHVFAAYGSTCVVTDAPEPVCFGLVTGVSDWPPAPTMTAPVVDIAISQDGACALQNDGTVKCWGTQNFASDSAPSGKVTAIATAEFGVFCALGSDHHVQCWGQDQYLPPDIPSEKMSAIAGGDIGRFCGLAETKDVICWGFIDEDRTPITTEGPFTALAMADHVCALGVDGRPHCWGARGPKDWGVTEPPAGSFASLVSRSVHSCALTEAGEATCWGRLHFEFESEVGDESPELLVAPDETFTAIVTGKAHMCGLTTSGEALCWGYGTSRDDIYTEPNLGQASPPGGTFVELAAGDFHTCGVRANGDVECWGNISTEHSDAF